MGHYCQICERIRPNEAFSGKGHRSHVCRQCQRLPKARKDRVRHLNELAALIAQSNLSAKNRQRLEALSQNADTEVRAWAAAILQVARHYPRRRGRYTAMASERPELLAQLKRVLGDAWWDDLQVSGALKSNDEDNAEAACPMPGGLFTSAPAPNPVPAPPATALKQVVIHTDGACQGNPGPGGWAAILRYGTHRKELKGGAPDTTNNRMELQAALAALRALRQPCAVEVVTDAKYLRDGITRWMRRWKANGWKTVEKTPVKNQDLWQSLDAECSRHQVQWRWIKGHDGHPDNEACDRLARAEIARARTR